MQNNKSSGFTSWMRDKGYYIVLVLCVAAVGISGYLYFSQSATPEGEATAAAAMEQEASIQPSDTPESVVSETQPVQETLSLQRPIAGEVVETFSTEQLAYNVTTQDWRVHNGVDLAAALGADVCAAAGGIVSATYEDDLLGHVVEITHEGEYRTRYCNLAPEICVQVGDEVVSGALIGTVGSSAKLEVAQEPHLHFEVYCGDTLLNPEAYWVS